MLPYRSFLLFLANSDIFLWIKGTLLILKQKKKKLLVILDMDAINGPTNREKQRLIRKIIQYNGRTLKWFSQPIK